MSIYTYGIMSIKEQSIEGKEDGADNLKVIVNKAYIDKKRGKSIDRPQLRQLKEDVVEGDSIYIESISKLGTNVNDLKDICDYFENKGVDICFIKEGVNTNKEGYGPIHAILNAIEGIQKEETIIRLQEGVERCKKIGITKTGRWFGRQKKNKSDLPKDFEKYYIEVKCKQISKIEMAKLLKCSRATVYRWINIYEGEK